MKNHDHVDDVLVIYCARNPEGFRRTYVVGWYKHATVYRRYESLDINDENGNYEYTQYYNALAKAEDCVLLPAKDRIKQTTWLVPRKQTDQKSYGLGQSNVWFANELDNEELQKYLQELCNRIENYHGKNEMDDLLN